MSQTTITKMTKKIKKLEDDVDDMELTEAVLKEEIKNITRERDELHAKLEFIFQQFRYVNNVRLDPTIEDSVSVEERTRRIHDCYYGRNGQFLLPHLTRVKRGEVDRIGWWADWSK